MNDKILAFHYDLKRAMWSADFMAEYAATLAGWGYNAILYELEDKLRFSRHPTIAHTDAITRDETRKRMAALRSLGLQVIPLVQTLGHAEYVLTKPGYERFRESVAHVNQYDPLSEQSRDLICELIDDAIEAVEPETFFHLGGDETRNLGESEKGKDVVARIGKGGLYLKHMLPIIGHVVKRGLRPILWADIALAHPEIIERFPREVVWMDWDYWTGAERWDYLHIWGGGQLDWNGYQAAKREGKIPSEFIQHLEQFAIDEQTATDGSFRGFPYTDALRHMGFDVITAPATRSYGDTMGIPFNSTHLPNCFHAARKGRDSGLGSCVTCWAVRHSHPLESLPGAFAAAEGFGTTSPYDYRELVRNFSEQRYGVAMPEFADAMRLAEQPVPWSESRELKPPSQAMQAVKAWLRSIDEQPGGREGLIEHVEKTASDIHRAERVFLDLRKRAKTNVNDFDYWLAGTRHNAFCAAFSLALLQNRLKEERPALCQRLATQRNETRRLFAATFPETTVDEESAVCCTFYESVLNYEGDGARSER